MRQVFFLLCILVFSCTEAQKTKADLIIYNAKVYTIDAAFSTAEAIAINIGKIEAVGTTKSLLQQYNPKQKRDAEGKFIYPGFIDAHAHFLNYCLGLQTADLAGISSWDSGAAFLAGKAK